MSDADQFAAADDLAEWAVQNAEALAELDRAAAQRMQRMQEAG